MYHLSAREGGFPVLGTSPSAVGPLVARRYRGRVHSEPTQDGPPPTEGAGSGPPNPREVLTRPAPAPDRTVAYGDHPDQVVDLRLPAPGHPDRPPVVVIHGGFWRAEYDRRHTDPLAADLASRGWPVIQLEYRRTGTPDGAWPATFEDVAAALATLPRLTGLKQAPLLLGHSAGGHLALWWAGRRRTARGVVALAPVADLAAAHAQDLDRGAVVALLGGDPAAVPDRFQYAQPAVPPHVPVTVIHGDQDQQVPMAISQAWVAAARAAGGDVALLALPGVEHFGLIDPRSSAWPAVVRTIVGHC